MNYISDLALDLGQFQLDHELENGMERSLKLDEFCISSPEIRSIRAA